MQHPFIFRPETMDEEIFYNINLHDEYRLPNSFQPEDIVIDIGMHIGSFCYAALQRGAGHVYGFEAEERNYECAKKNLQSFEDRVHLYHKAIWRSDKAVDKLTFTCSNNSANTGGGSTIWEHDPQQIVDVIALDEVLRDVTHNGRKRVRMLKIDCEGSEFPILLTSRKLHLIDCISGEFHEFLGEYDPHQAIPERARIAGVERFTIVELMDVLNSAGFSVTWARHEHTNLGLFYAYRPTQPAASLKSPISKRYVAWVPATYGHETPPGVISSSALMLDGYEGSHLGHGWHETEQDFRWTMQRAVIFLHRTMGQDVLEIELSSGPEALGAVGITIQADRAKLKQEVRTSSWQRIKMRLPALAAEQCILPITITVDHTRNAGQLGAGDPRELGVAVRSVRLEGKPRSIDLALSSICNPEHWKHPFWRQCVDSMAFKADFGIIAADVQHRKMWEWIQGISGLARLGCLKSSAHALGVAAGHEPVIYWLASRVAKVYATDLYSGSFAGNEASPEILRDPDTYAPYPYPRDRVHFIPMNGTDICFGDETIDFVFSFCSIEHFGSRENSRRSLQEMARVLRPGGVAVVSTEVLLNDVGPQEEMFSPWELYEELVAPSGLLLIGDIASADLAPFYADPIDLSSHTAPYAHRPHFVLRYNETLFTSVILFLQKWSM